MSTIFLAVSSACLRELWSHLHRMRNPGTAFRHWLRWSARARPECASARVRGGPRSGPGSKDAPRRPSSGRDASDGHPIGASPRRTGTGGCGRGPAAVRDARERDRHTAGRLRTGRSGESELRWATLPRSGDRSGEAEGCSVSRTAQERNSPGNSAIWG